MKPVKTWCASQLTLARTDEDNLDRVGLLRDYACRYSKVIH
jgi:hypothetical protein